MESVVTRARHFQFKPDGEVTFMMAQDAVGLPAPLMQVCLSATLFYAYAHLWMHSTACIPHAGLTLMCILPGHILPQCMDSIQCLQLHVCLIQVCPLCSATGYGQSSTHSVAGLLHAGLLHAYLLHAGLSFAALCCLQTAKCCTAQQTAMQAIMT